MPAKKRALPEFVTANEEHPDGPDSDDEGLAPLQAARDAQAARGNITAAELPESGDIIITEAKSKKRITLSLQNRNSIKCAVCGQTGHTAGFIGAVYVDCPVKPCYLCKKLGHTAATCPFRMDPTLDVAAAPGTTPTNVCSNLTVRETSASPPRACRLRNLPRRHAQWRIRSACLKLHPRRVTALAFPPGSVNLVCSADKKGLIGIWDFDEVNERTVFENVHEYQINSLSFLPGRDGMSLLTASCDGLACVLDVETGSHHALANLNPGGWVDGVSNEKNWNMFQACATHQALPDTAWASDNQGKLYQLDLRQKDVASRHRIHASGNKVTSLNLHPCDANVLLTAGNDHVCKIFDARKLAPLKEGAKSMCQHVVSMAHPKVISAASFSPRTGRTVMTTCGDNRIRVWDDVSRADQPASRELVHSHDFNRYLSPFKAVWDPKDATERTIVCGRYISEDHGGAVLHPIDVIDAGTGALLDSLIDPNLQLINPVNLPHPVLDVLITGSSGHVYCWRPEEEDSDDDAVVVAGETAPERKSDGKDRIDAGGASSSGAGGAQPAIRGSKFFSAYDVSAEEKRQRKKQNSDEKASKTKQKQAEAKTKSVDNDNKKQKKDRKK